MNPLLDSLCKTRDATSPWQELSDLHRQVYSELHMLINDYLEGKCGSADNECVMPVIYGLYGSGKTTLMVQVCKDLFEKEIPVMRVDLSDILEYANNLHKQSIPEDKLPELLEDFFQEELKKKGAEKLVEKFRGNNRGVLFVDEVEESYAEFRKKIKGISILRGLADRIRTAQSRLFVIMAFAPSSAMEEAATKYATSWRVKLVEVPTADVDFIYRNYLSHYDITDLKDLKTLLANTIWWMSKGGRIGWVSKIMREGVIDSTIKTLQYIMKSRSTKDLYVCFWTPGSPEASNIKTVLDIKPTEETPLFNFAYYENMLEEVNRQNLELGRDLTKILPCLVGPVSTEILTRLLGGSPRAEKLPHYIKGTNEIVGIEEIKDVYEEELRRIKVQDEKIKTITKFIDSILRPLSYNGVLLYDREELRFLLEDILVSNLIENGYEELASYLARIDCNRILHDALRKTSMHLPNKEYYYWLRPSTLRSLFPLPISNPFIGCSKGVRIDEILRKLETTNIEQLSNKLLIELTLESSEHPNYSIYPVLTKDLRTLEKSIRKDIQAERYVILLLFNKLVNDPPSKDDLPGYYESLYGKIIIPVELPSPLAQYVLGLLYSSMICPEDLNNLRGEDKIIRKRSNSYLREIKDQAIHEAQKHAEKLQDATELFPDEFNKLENIAHSEVGESHGEFLRIIASSDQSYDYLFKLLNQLNKLTTTIDSVSLLYDIGDGEDVKKGVASALANGPRYMERTRNAVMAIQKLGDEYKEFASQAVALFNILYLHDSESCRTFVKGEDLDIYSVIDEISRLLSDYYGLPIDKRAAIPIIVSSAIKDVYDKECLMESFDPGLAPLINNLNKLGKMLKKLRDLHKEFDSAKNELLGVSASTIESQLTSIINDITSIEEGLRMLQATRLSPYSFLLLYSYIRQNFKKFGENINKVVKRIEELSSYYMEFLIELNNIRNSMSKVSLTSEVRNDIREDLGDILKPLIQPGSKISAGLLENIISQLRGYEKLIHELEEIVKSLGFTEVSKIRDETISKLKNLINEGRL